MSAFAWRRRMTPHFGEQWVPFAQIHLQSTSGRWYAFSVQVDTGAVISVLSRSAADLLGIRLDSGKLIELAAIGGSAQRYFVHPCAARLGAMPQFKMRTAIAEREEVPNLLGRLDVVDRFQIDLDASLEETRITPPWLDPDGRRIWRHFLDVDSAILRAWSDHRLPGRIDEAARRFVNRSEQLVAAGAGLLKLQRHFELPLVIRSLFELALQFEYLMKDAEARAALYLDFEHITKHRSVEAFVQLPGPFGDRLRASPLRDEGEKRNRAEFDRVRDQFAAKRGSRKVRRHWYPGTLRDLAKDLDRTAEYEAIYGLYSGWAHGDPWTSSLLKLEHGGLMHLYTYWARILIQVADAKKIRLSGEAYQSLVVLAKGITKA